MKSTKIILKNCSLIDANNEKPSAPCTVVINNDIIESITHEKCSDENAKVIDLHSHFLLPGLIDNHSHVSATQIDLSDANIPESYRAIQAKDFLERMLQRGFTSLRDAGGADYGLVLATERGLINGPRIFPSNKAISQTGGHGDFYARNEPFDACFCRCGGSSISVIADGIAAVRKTVREQIRQGATQIKIMASGGVASPTDNIHNVQFSEEEISAIVDEANHASTYVMAHAYTPEAISRCVNNGVRSIEHGNLLDEKTARLMHAKGAYLVPTMVVYHSLALLGKEEGFPAESLAKLPEVIENALHSVEIARRENVKVGFGTDLLGPKSQAMQSEEFNIRKRGSETAHQIICSATAINAEILHHENKLGIIKQNAFADLIAVDGNPLNDISLLTGQGEHLSLIMKAGKIYKNTI